MKKTLLCAAVVAMTLAACSKNESTEIPGVTHDTKSINFSASTGITRANALDLAALQTDANGFQVVGITVPESGNPTTLFTKPTNTMENNYKWNTSAWEWTSTTDKVWPSDPTKYPIQFFAFYPSVAQNKATDFEAAYDADHSGGYQNGVWEIPVASSGYGNITISTNNPDDQEDYLFAKAKTGLTSPTSGKLALEFQHIMSNVSFNVVLPEGYKAYIKSLRLRNVGGNDSGQRSFITFNTNPDLIGTWTSEGDQSVEYGGNFYYTIGNNVSILHTGVAGAQPVPVTVVAANGATFANATMKMMPQEKTTGWDKTTFKALYDAWEAAGSNKNDYNTMVINAMKGAYIELVYALVDDNGTSVVGKVKDTNLLDGTPYTDENRLVRVAFPLDFAATPWEQGMKYAYNIRLGMPDSTNGTVTDPDYKGDDGTDKPGEDLDNPAVNPGDEVTKKGNIGFDVTVSVWTDAAGTDIK